MKPILLALWSLLFVASYASVSVAQNQRSFVSALGNDLNPCTRAAPCRTFAQAISLTNAGGEVVALDSAGYGAIPSITKSVSIIAPPGVYAGMSVFSGDGIDINAGPSDTVTLRGLTINNQGSTGSGIVFNSGATLHVESCVVNAFSNPNSAGLEFLGSGKLEVKDSIMRGNGSGILVVTASGTAVAAIDQVRLEANTHNGLTAFEGSRVTVRGSIASGNNVGFSAVSRSTAPAELNIESCVALNNSNVGILCQTLSTGIATVRVSNSTVTDNNAGLFNAGGLLLSRGNNTVEGNGTDLDGAIGSYTAK